MLLPTLVATLAIWLALYQGNRKMLTHLPARNQQDQPNGYADFVATNQLLQQIPELNGDNYLQSGAALRRVLDKHRNVFALIETGLGHAVQTCVGSDQSYSNVGKLSFINSAHLVKSQQERFEKKFDESIETSFNTALVAQSLSKEGNALSLLEGLSMEQQCYPTIQIALPDASREALETTLGRLKKIDRQAPSPCQATQNELAWAWNSENWYGKLSITHFQIMVPNSWFYQYIILNSSVVECQTHRRLLTIAIALELYRRDRSVFPDRLADLATTGLLEERILVDPFAEEFQLIYQNSGDDYELYSRGVDGVDDDGVITRNANGDRPDINLKAAAKQMCAEEATGP